MYLFFLPSQIFILSCTSSRFIARDDARAAPTEMTSDDYHVIEHSGRIDDASFYTRWSPQQTMQRIY
jgi:hypothetical protein